MVQFQTELNSDKLCHSFYCNIDFTRKYFEIFSDGEDMDDFISYNEDSSRNSAWNKNLATTLTDYFTQKGIDFDNYTSRSFTIIRVDNVLGMRIIVVDETLDGLFYSNLKTSFGHLIVENIGIIISKNTTQGIYNFAILHSILDYYLKANIIRSRFTYFGLRKLTRQDEIFLNIRLNGYAMLNSNPSYLASVNPTEAKVVLTGYEIKDLKNLERLEMLSSANVFDYTCSYLQRFDNPEYTNTAIKADILKKLLAEPNMSNFWKWIERRIYKYDTTGK